MIYIKKPRTSQPQFAANVDWESPLSAGLIFAWTASKPLTNAVPGVNQVDFVNGGLYFETPRDKGVVRKTSANGTIEQRFRFLRSIPPSTPLTYGVAFRLIAYHPEGNYNLTNDAFATHFIRVNSLLKIEGGANSFVPNSLVTSDNSYSSGDWLYVVMTAENGAWTMYVNGIKQSTVGSGGLSGLSEDRVDLNGSGLEFLTAFAAQGAWPADKVRSWTNNPWQLFAPSKITVLPQSDTYTTQWTPSSGTDHYALIDETTANDADYISATAAGQTDEVRLASMTAPQASTDLLINYRVQGIVGSATVTMSLRQGSGGTLIATDTAKNTDNTYQLVVPAATWASVTDWTDLRLRFVSA